MTTDKELNMPINLTQEFTFETDDLNTFERMLPAVCPILFAIKPQGIPIHYGRWAYFQEDYPSHTTAWYLRLEGPVYPPPQPLHGVRPGNLQQRQT